MNITLRITCAPILRPSCTAEIDGSAEVVVSEAQLVVHVFAGSAELVPADPSCKIIEVSRRDLPPVVTASPREIDGPAPTAAQALPQPEPEPGHSKLLLELIAPSPAREPQGHAPAVGSLLRRNILDLDAHQALVNVMCPADGLTPNVVDCGLASFFDRQLAGGFGRGDRLYRQPPVRTGKPQAGYQLPLTPEQFYKAALLSRQLPEGTDILVLERGVDHRSSLFAVDQWCGLPACGNPRRL